MFWRHLAAVTIVAWPWPIGDLAVTVSLSVATAQQLVIMLLVASFMLRRLPTVILVRLTGQVLSTRWITGYLVLVRQWSWLHSWVPCVAYSPSRGVHSRIVRALVLALVTMTCVIF